MMNIDVRKLNAQKQYSGRLEFDYDAPEELLSIPFVQFAAPVKVVAEYELFEDDSLELRGKVIYRLVGKCSRCLKDSSCEVVGELDAYFQPTKDCEDYAYSGSIIHLKEAIDDAIMSSMPFSLSCGEACEGIAYSS